MAKILPLIIAGGAAAVLLNKKKKTKKSESKPSGNGYGEEYGEGSVGGNYRLATIQGQSCGNCKYAMVLKDGYSGTSAPSGGAKAYCEYWKTAVGAEYVCDAFSTRANS